MITRRAALHLLGTSAGLALVAACGPAAPAPTAPTSAPAAAPPAPASTLVPVSSTLAVAAVTPTVLASGAQPRTGGTLRLGHVGEVAPIDPHFSGPPTSTTLWHMFDRLLERNLDGTLTPSLAEGVETSPDGKNMTIHLRSGVQFHTGRTLTSDDIKWNIMRVRDPSIQGGQLATFSKVFTSMDTPDPNTVVLALDAPRPVAADLFWRMNIADQQAFASDDPVKHMVGTGPFKLMEWVQGDHISMTRNASYWQSGRPYLDGVQIQINKDAQSTGVQLEANGADISDGLLIQDVVRLRQDPAYHVDSVDNGSVYTLEANVRNAPTSNKLVRQALQFAINRQRVVDSVLLGQGEVTAEGWPSSSIAYDPALATAYNFDLDKAKSLLQQAGGGPITLEFLVYQASPDLVQFAQIFQSDLASIGVTVNLKSVDPPAWLAAVTPPNSSYQHLTAGPWGPLTNDPDALFSTSPYLNPAGNIGGYEDAHYKELVAQGGSEPDPSKRKQIYQELTGILVDQAFNLPFVSTRSATVYRANVNGVQQRLSDAMNLRDAWIG
jgi:peptide/nickel transport system substrate-binding protein